MRHRRTKAEIEGERSVIPADATPRQIKLAVQYANYEFYQSHSARLDYGAHRTYKNERETARIRQRFLDRVRWNIANIHDPPLTPEQRAAQLKVRQLQTDREERVRWTAYRKALGEHTPEKPKRTRAKRVTIKP